MKEFLVLAEHRRGEIREISFEMLTKGRELAQKMGAELTAVLLGYNVRGFAENLSNYAGRVLLVDDEKLQNFNAEAYQRAMSHLISERNPLLTLIGHTSYGVDLAPSLATELDIPLATDCIDLYFEGEKMIVHRQVYGGKANVKASLRKSERYMVTLRPATFEVEECEPQGGEIVEVPSPISEEIQEKRFIEFYEPPAGDVDITAADVIVAVGRGIKDADNMQVAKDLAEKLGGVLAGSRPVVDKGWLSKDRQVGTSGKTVKPKLYIALGISGQFQHVSGMKNSDLIIAVNKDAKAPIFRTADYGIVEDLLKVAPSLTQKITEEKASA